jgi:hypothetical protein
VTVRLADYPAAFQGVVPALLATCSADGEPNATYLSQVHYIDERRVALSCQFFNKSKRNVLENPYASVRVYEPVSWSPLVLRLRYQHAETEGPLFDVMSARIQVIASHTGMAGVFKLLSADVYEVLSVELDAGEFSPPAAAHAHLSAAVPPGPLTELRGLRAVSDRINQARDLDGLLGGALLALDEVFGFAHSMLLLPEHPGNHLVAIASRGYGGTVGAEACLGAGVIGVAAKRGRMVRVAGFGASLRYGRAVRERTVQEGLAAILERELPLPGLPDAQAQLALPLFAAERLVGVLAVESGDPLQFDEWDEAFLQVVGNQIALGIERFRKDDEEAPGPALSAAPAQPGKGARTRRLTYYRNDDCIFIDGEYLVRNVPAKILWKVLDLHQSEGRCEFSNRELRLDPSLGLPDLRDNLESRLLLLRKRLQEKCPDLRLVPVRRGRFALERDCALELVTRDST